MSHNRVRVSLEVEATNRLSNKVETGIAQIEFRASGEIFKKLVAFIFGRKLIFSITGGTGVAWMVAEMLFK